MKTATKVKILAIVLLISLSLAVIIQNTEPIEAKLLFLTLSIPLTFLIGGSLIVGYLLGLLTPVLWRRSHRPGEFASVEAPGGPTSDMDEDPPPGR